MTDVIVRALERYVKGEVSEQWRAVLGWEGLYEVSDKGRVRSIPGPYRRGGVMRLHMRNGYWRVTLRHHDIIRNCRVHRLVAEAFCERTDDRQIVRHLDGNKVNNVPSNLAWGTYSENTFDMVEHGHHANARKTHCKNGHEYTPENTRAHGNDGQYRNCRTCTYEANRRVRQAKKGAGGCVCSSCPDAPVARGLCGKHYQAARKAERKGAA